MRDSLRRRCALLAAVLLASVAPAFAEGKTVRTESWKMENRNEVFAWIPERLPAFRLSIIPSISGWVTSFRFSLPYTDFVETLTGGLAIRI